MTDATELTSENLIDLVRHALEEGKAQDVVIIDLTGKTDIADYMVVSSATSSRHASHLADSVVMAAKSVEVYPPPPEGGETGDWMLIDLESVIVHVFRKEIREIYKLERMWGPPTDADATEADDGREAQSPS